MPESASRQRARSDRAAGAGPTPRLPPTRFARPSPTRVAPAPKVGDSSPRPSHRSPCPLAIRRGGHANHRSRPGRAYGVDAGRLPTVNAQKASGRSSDQVASPVSMTPPRPPPRVSGHRRFGLHLHAETSQPNSFTRLIPLASDALVADPFACALPPRQTPLGGRPDGSNIDDPCAGRPPHAPRDAPGLSVYLAPIETIGLERRPIVVPGCSP